MLSQKYPSFDTAFKQYLMSLVGTVIYQPGTSDSQGPTFKFLGQGDPALITALLDGGNSAAFMPATPPTSASTPRRPACRSAAAMRSRPASTTC
jgi:conjugative transfer pilus assembly protein TraH